MKLTPAGKFWLLYFTALVLVLLGCSDYVVLFTWPFLF